MLPGPSGVLCWGTWPPQGADGDGGMSMLAPVWAGPWS